MQLTLFVYNINSKYFCIKSGLNYLRYKRYKRNETEGHIFFCNLNVHRNGIYILYIDCYHHRKIYILHWLVVSLYIEQFWAIIYHINTFKSYFHELFCKSWFIFSIYKANVLVLILDIWTYTNLSQHFLESFEINIQLEYIKWNIYQTKSELSRISRLLWA